MENQEKPFEWVVEWNRWTVGIAWQYWESSYGNRLEFSLQIPVVALSIVVYL